MSLEAEMSVIASVLMDNAVMDDVFWLEPRDFTQTKHELLWKGMKYMYDNNLPIDIVTLAEVLVKYRRLEEIGGIPFISELAQSLPTSSNAKYYARIVRDTAIRRRGRSAGEAIIRLSDGVEDTEDMEEYYSKVERLACAIRPSMTSNMVRVSESRKGFMENLMKQENRLLTGYKNFDEWSNGLSRGWLVILAGRPSVGKTAKIMQQAVHMAKQDIGEILVWSQEMSRDQLISRMISPISRVHAGRIRKKTLETHEVQKIDTAYDELDKLPLHIEDSSGVTIDHIAATARQFKRMYGRIGAIIVDYLTIMDIKQERGQNWSKAVGEVTKRAKRLAREIDTPFIMLAQLNREGAEVEPQLHHLRDSGEIEQDADMVEFLWHNSEETAPDGKIIQSFIAKGRDVGVNRFKYKFIGYQQRYEDYNG
jgi:replicative DNA helicase